MAGAGNPARFLLPDRPSDTVHSRGVPSKPVGRVQAHDRLGAPFPTPAPPTHAPCTGQLQIVAAAPR